MKAESSQPWSLREENTASAEKGGGETIRAAHLGCSGQQGSEMGVVWGWTAGLELLEGKEFGMGEGEATGIT